MTPNVSPSVPESSDVECGPLHGTGPYLEALGSQALGLLAAALWKAHKDLTGECRRLGGADGRAECRDALAILARDIAGELARRDWLVRRAQAVRS
jgi:hypothetical protein